MSFDDIRNQDDPIKFLKAAIKNEKLSHAYIFAGPRGCGRSLLARNFAKAVNCEREKNVPCDSCASCKKIDKDSHPDVRWIRKDEKGKQIKISEMRELQSQIILKPYEGRYKVCIIVDAELMTTEAANSFLKTLEEPPCASLLILITEKPKDLLPTIVSRCQTVRLKPLGRDKLASILVSDYGMRKEKAEFLSGFCEGRLEKAINYGDDILKRKNAILEEFSGDECVENYSAKNRGELSEKLNMLASWYRDLLIFKSMGNESLLINRDRIGGVKKNAVNYKTDELIRMLEGVLNAKEKIESNVNPKLALTALFTQIHR